ncbi:MAG: tRNA glutamyl-Q(34) synthetase GluQRS [Planctomycetaceae bacterium]|nr:MAG: tRNA glutamyl-Q(34) synthetase GluQRS [Planctomycetaceae bacterium]
MPIPNVAVGRLAPSPTGAQHLGNARTFLIAWLSARAIGGRVVLRVEDIDSPRVKVWATDQAMEDLRWLGLDWDEGPDVGGPHGPYLQTQRTAGYAAALDRLIGQGLAYPCTCTRADVESAASAPHERSPQAAPAFGSRFLGEGPVYSGRCRGWRLGDRLPAEGTYCWRFRMPDRDLDVDDQVHGALRLNPRKLLGDFPLTRKSGQAAYQLAVVVDDAAMGISEIVRGDDLLPSVFRQLPLIEALGYRVPTYAHVPLVVGVDGRRLAKRHGDTRLAQFRELGVAPQQIIGWAAHSIGLIDAAVPVEPRELVEFFAWRRVRREPSVWDPGSGFQVDGDAADHARDQVVDRGKNQTAQEARDPIKQGRKQQGTQSHADGRGDRDVTAGHGADQRNEEKSQPEQQPD